MTIIYDCLLVVVFGSCCQIHGCFTTSVRDAVSRDSRVFPPKLRRRGRHSRGDKGSVFEAATGAMFVVWDRIIKA